MSRFAIVAALLAGGASVPVFGQAVIAPPEHAAPDAPPHPAATQSTDPGALGEIVVTANKRQENMSKVGVTITALSGAVLADRRIVSLQDVATAVPGLSFSPSTTGSPILTLRGVGFNESSLGVYPAVSSYIDQAPLPFPVMTTHSAYDLERVEVLKGPQGTLFGENSTGGAINFVAAKPTSHFEAGGDLTYGRFNTVEGNAYVSGPLTDTLGVRVAVTGHRMDDWRYSITRNDTNGHQNYFGGRSIVDWKPSQAARFSLNINGWKDGSQPQALQFIALRPQIPAYAAAQYPTLVFAPNNARAADWTGLALDPSTGAVNPATGAVSPNTSKLVDFEPYGHQHFFQAALRADMTVVDGITLTSITSYDDFVQHQSIDTDGSAYVIQNLTHDDGSIHSFNQEIRLANSPSASFRWTLGTTYERSVTDEYQLDRNQGSSEYNPGNLFINASGIDNHQSIRNYAGFGNAEYAITNRITLKGGVRYTGSINSADICSNSIVGGNVDKLFNLLGSELGTVPFTPIGPSGCYSLNENFVPGEPFQKQLKESNVSWRAGIDYQASSQTLLYANVSRGYKAGSFPSLAAALYTGLQPVTQESVTAYEAGIKAQMFDRHVRFDGAFFYYDYRNKQVRGKLADPVFGDLDALINVPKSRIYGAEADVVISPLRGLTLSTAVTFLNSRIQRYTGVNIVGQPGFNAAGDPLPFTPKWSSTVNIDYRTEAFGGNPFIGFGLNVRSSSEAAISARRVDYADAPGAVVKPGVGCVFCLNSYATVDARIGFEGNAGKWKVTLWGKNILNKYYWTNVISTIDSAARVAAMPATYGITIGLKI